MTDPAPPRQKCRSYGCPEVATIGPLCSVHGQPPDVQIGGTTVPSATAGNLARIIGQHRFRIEYEPRAGDGPVQMYPVIECPSCPDFRMVQGRTEEEGEEIKNALERHLADAILAAGYRRADQ